MSAAKSNFLLARLRIGKDFGWLSACSSFCWSQRRGPDRLASSR
jgi:hypothetical protein